MKILMVGASGKYAHDVVPALKAHGAMVKALVTSEDKRAEAIAQGADETAVGDLNDEQSLRTAAEGVDGVFHLNPAFAPNEAELGRTITPREITFDEWVRRTHIQEGPFRDGMQRMFADYGQYGFPGGNALVLRAILGREPRTLRDFFKEQAHAHARASQSS